MTHEQMYKAVREKVIEVCPELMELSFGCKVNIRKGKMGYWGDSKIGKGTVIDTFLGKKVSHSGYDPVEDNISAVLDNGTIRTTFSCSKNGVEILGHPIRISHVLRAMGEASLPNNEFLATYLYQDTKQKDFWICHKKESDYVLNREEYVISSKKWDLEKDDLAQQSPETIKFLFDILCK